MSDEEQEQEQKIGNNGEEIVEYNEDDSRFDDEFDRFVEECSEDLDKRLEAVLTTLKKENPANFFTDERRFWRSVMAKAEYQVGMMSEVPKKE